MDLVKLVRRLKDKHKVKDNPKLYREIFSKYIDIKDDIDSVKDYINTIHTTEDKTQEGKNIRRIAANNIFEKLDTDYLSNIKWKNIEELILKEYIIEGVRLYADRTRRSGIPSITHGIEVGARLLKKKVPLYTVLAGIGHDNIEDITEDIVNLSEKIRSEHESNNNLLDQKRYDAISDEAKKQIRNLIENEKLNPDNVSCILIQEEYKRLENSFKNAVKKYMKDFGHEEATMMLKNYHSKWKDTKLYTAVTLQKVTRFERDENYYISIDRLISDNLNYNPRFDWLRESFIKEHKVPKIHFTEEEKIMCIISAIMDKYVDRCSNTVDFHQPEEFVKRIRVHFKNDIVIDSSTKERNVIKDKLSEGKKELLDINNKFMDYNGKLIDSRHDKNTFLGKIYFFGKKLIEKQEDSYDKRGGFNRLDYGFEWNLFSGSIRGIFDKTITKTGRYDPTLFFINNSDCVKQIVIKGLDHLNSQYQKKDDFTLSGFDNLGGEQKLGFLDNMGTKYSALWVAKWGVRKIIGVKSQDSFYHRKLNNTN